jgi:hypothetical protein
MNYVVASFPDHELHAVLDDLDTHKKCESWLKQHPKVHFHFTPTRASWFNQDLVVQGQSLKEHIDAFVTAYNETAVPFAWTEKRVYQRRFKNRRIIQL